MIMTAFHLSTVSRRRFIASAVAAGLTAPLLGKKASAQVTAPTVSKPDDVFFTSALDLAGRIQRREISSVELVKAYLDRIDEVNPQLNAVVQIVPERALAEAERADDALMRGQSTGPLHGLPFTIKDSLDTEGIITTAGTLGRRNKIPTRDATAVARLRAAGAILLGKTNTPEFTLSYQTSNLIYGRTRNPYHLGHQPGGSSGGAGSIIAAGGAVFDLGTDFGGSIRVPAHNCGIAGLKPTTGRVPRTGHIVDYGGVFDPFQVVGPMARWVEDLDLLTRVITGPDGIDAALIPVPWKDYRNVDISTLKVAFYINNGSVTEPTPETSDAVRRSVAALTAAGATATEDCPVALLRESQQLRSAMGAADGREWVRRMVRQAGTRQVSPNLGLGDNDNLADTNRFTEIVELLDLNRSKLLQWFKQYDVIVAPINPGPADPWTDSFDRPSPTAENIGHTPVYNNTGWPATAVRAGTSPEGLPIGVQILAHPFREDISLAAAAAVEASTGGYIPPTFT